MSCLWKLIKFSVIVWDSKNGATMSIKICVATCLVTDVYVYCRINHKKEQIALEKCNSTAHHCPEGVNSSAVHRGKCTGHQVTEYINGLTFDFQNYLEMFF